MPKLSTIEISPYSPHQLYDLVVDVARYPEFLPWVKAARILSRTDTEMMAELVVGFMNITERYTSRIALFAPTESTPTARVEVALVKGPFTHLTNHWRFRPQPHGAGTEIHLDLDFAFKSRLLENIIGGIFERASLKMAAAFRDRASALYGTTTAHSTADN